MFWQNEPKRSVMSRRPWRLPTTWRFGAPWKWLASPITKHVIVAAQRLRDPQCYFYQIAINSLKRIDLNLNKRVEKTQYSLKKMGASLYLVGTFLDARAVN